jgi:CheY-like chemotaxis protein/anti-sigma regulatory factor (Ser/Thr protein kinase)
MLYGDELRIKQILSNLLSNAFKYTKRGTVELGISCVRDGDVVWMTAYVKDTGIGIKPEAIDRIFANYSQVDTKANRVIEGTGLGLSIAQKMINMMGGTISVESEYGKGSTFTMIIKQKHVNNATIGSKVIKNLKSFRYADNKRKEQSKLVRIKLPYANVLVVDDNATNLDIAKGLMKPYGMQIDCVTSGQQSIDAIREENKKYNAVFMDHMMPGMDGIEAAAKIREIGTDYAKNIPIIALTANAIVGNEKMFLSKGFQAFISKPIDVVRLDAVIRKWVRDKEMDEIIPDNAPEQIALSTMKILSYKIDGIDLRKTLERFSDDEEMLLHILRSYTTNTKTLLKKIKEVSMEDLADYAATVHGIKGASRCIGADEIGAMAEKLEHASKAWNFDVVRENNPSFLEATKKLVAALDNMLAEIGLPL